MKVTPFLFAVAVHAAAAFAYPFGAPPDATHAWAVHDENRPPVKKITADVDKPPSDATVLFDGTAKSLADNWCDRDGKPTKWALDANGELISVRNAGYIFTKRKFADCQLHVEWASPKNVQGTGQGRGNSGVFLMGEYEIQVLDSYETNPDKTPNPNPCSQDGMAGAAYGQNPPAVNPCRAPGVFNTFDIVFHAPRFAADGSLLRPATATVLFNGVLVQDGWRFDGPTRWRLRSAYSYPGAAGIKREKKMPLAIQDHGNPVHYRNIWIREIPSPDDNVTDGEYYAVEEKVLELRRKTADRLDAEFDAKWGGAKPGTRLVEAWRVVTYFATPDRLARAADAEKRFLSAANGVAAKDMTAVLGVDKSDLSLYYGHLLRLKFVKPENPVIDLLKKMR